VKEERKVKLYHGTDDTKLNSILKHGLLPRSRKKGNWKDAPSRSDCVYLTNAYAPYFINTSTAKKDGMGLILEVDTNKLNERKLLPDEDAIEQTGRRNDGVEGDCFKRARYFRDRLHNYDDGQWEQSLDVLGTCAYKGKIPNYAITRIALIPYLYFLWWDASITLMNYRLLGGKYRNQTARLFGDRPPDLSDPFGLNEWRVPMSGHTVWDVVDGGVFNGRQIQHPDERRKMQDILSDAFPESVSS